MKKKYLMATGIMIAALGIVAPAAYAEETQVNTETMTEADMTNSVATEPEKEEETQKQLIEEDALTNQHLKDISYENGELTEKGWENTFLNMEFTPTEDIVMGVDENATIQEYHNRNGEENAVAVNEMVAYTEDGKSFVQLMVEVNPNKELAEDILGRFTKNEGLKDPTEVRSITIADKTFATTTGELDGDHYFLAISTDQDGIAIAIKMKYANAMKKRELTKGFNVLEAESINKDAETESGVELDELEAVQLPAEFEMAQDEIQTEDGAEEAE